MNTKHLQKTTFLLDEGDAWLNRNLEYLKNKDYSQDPIIHSINKIIQSDRLTEPLKILEIGCGDGGAFLRFRRWLIANAMELTHPKRR